MNNKELLLMRKWFRSIEKENVICGRHKCEICQPIRASFAKLLLKLEGGKN